ncbi:MAG TPA: hypothetical protein PLY45_01995, partial [bacterium]|nr:hypothetical protein [bacterium]
PAEELDAYVRCAELYRYNGAFTRDCNAFPEGKSQNACQSKIVNRFAWNSILMLFGVAAGAFASRYFPGMMSTVSLIDLRDKQEFDPVI